MHVKEEEILRGAYAQEERKRKREDDTSVIVHMRCNEDSKRPSRPLLAKLRHSCRHKPRNFVDQHSAAHASTSAISPMSSRIFTPSGSRGIQLVSGTVLKIRLTHYIQENRTQYKPKPNELYDISEFIII